MNEAFELVTGSLSRAPWGWVMMFTLLGTLIKVWPVIQLQTMNAAAVLRGEQRDDLHNCNEKLDELRAEFDAQKIATTEQIHQLDLRLVGTMTAYRILHADASEHRPDSSALVQARAIFTQTWTGPVPDWMQMIGMPVDKQHHS